MFKKNIYILSILIIYIIQIGICSKIKANADINKIETHYEQGKLRIQFFVPISPEEQQDFQNFEQMSSTDKSALNYKFYDDFQFKRSGNTVIDCDDYPKRIQIMIGQVNKRLSSLEYDNFDDASRLENTQDSYEFKFVQMNLRRHKFDFVAKCVGDNVYVHLMIKQKSAILYLNNYVNDGIRYLQILRFAYPFDGSQYQEIYHQPLTYIEEEQHLQKLSFYQYDSKGKDIITLDTVIEPEEVDISIPGFIFAHTYTDIQILVSLSNDTLKIYAIEHDEEEKNYVYLRYLLKIDQNSNKIEGEIFDLTNNQIVASCETDLKPITQKLFNIEYRFLAGMFGKTQYQTFMADLNQDVIVDKYILMMENSWLDEDKEEIRTCLIQQTSGQDANQIELNWKMYEVKKKKLRKDTKSLIEKQLGNNNLYPNSQLQKFRKDTQSFRESLLNDDELNPNSQIRTIRQEPEPQEDLTKTIKPGFSNVMQQQPKREIQSIEVLSKDQLAAMQNNLKSLYKDVNKLKTINIKLQNVSEDIQQKKPQRVSNLKTKKNQSNINQVDNSQRLNDKIQQLLIEKPRQSKNKKSKLIEDEKSNEEDLGQILLDLQDQTKTFRQIPLQNYQLTKQLSLDDHNLQFNKDNYKEPFIKYVQNNKEVYISANFSQQENLFQCTHYYTNVLEVTQAFQRAQELKIIINNIEVKGLLNLFRINGFQNLIIQKNVNLAIVQKFLQQKGDKYYCNFTINKTKQLMLNIIEKKYQFQFYTRASKFQDMVNMEMFFINLTTGNRIYNTCSKRLNQAQIKAASKSIIHLGQNSSQFSQKIQNVNIQNFILYDFTSNLTFINLTMKSFYISKDFNCSIQYIQENQYLAFNKYIYDKNNSFIFTQVIPFQNSFNIYRYDLNQQQGKVVLVTLKQLPIIENTTKRQLVTYEKNRTKFFNFVNEDYGNLINLIAYQYQQFIPDYLMLSLEPGRVFIGISSNPDQLLTIKVKQGNNQNQINLLLEKLIAPKDNTTRDYNFKNLPQNELKLIGLFDQRQDQQQNQIGLATHTQNTDIDYQFVFKQNQSIPRSILQNISLNYYDGKMDIVIENQDRTLDTRLVQSKSKESQNYSDIYDKHQNLYAKIKQSPLVPIESTKEPEEVQPLKQQVMQTVNHNINEKTVIPTVEEKTEDNIEMLRDQLIHLYEENKGQDEIYLPPEALETMTSFMKHKEYLDKLKNGKHPDEISKPQLPHHLDPEYTGSPSIDEKLSAQKEQLEDLQQELEEAKANELERKQAELEDQIKAVKQYIAELEDQKKEEEGSQEQQSEENFDRDFEKDQANVLGEEEGEDVLNEEQIRDKRVHQLQEDLYQVEQKIKKARENNDQEALEPLLKEQQAIGDTIEKVGNGTLLEEEENELNKEVKEIDDAVKELEKSPENAQTIIELDEEEQELEKEKDEVEGIEIQLDEIDGIKQRISELEGQLLRLEQEGQQKVKIVQVKGELDALIQRKHQIESEKAGKLDSKSKVLGWAEAADNQKNKEVLEYPEEEIKLLTINNIGNAREKFEVEDDITVSNIDNLKEIAINLQIAFQMIFRDIEDIDFNKKTPYHEEKFLEKGMKIFANTRTFIISQDVNRVGLRKDINFLQSQVDQLEKKQLGFLKFYNTQDQYENALKEGDQSKDSILQLEKELSQLSEQHNSIAKECEEYLKDVNLKNMELYNLTEDLRRTMDYDSLDPIEKIKSAVKIFPEVEENRNKINENLNLVIQKLDSIKMMQKEVLKILQEHSVGNEDDDEEVTKSLGILSVYSLILIALFQIIQNQSNYAFPYLCFKQLNTNKCVIPEANPINIPLNTTFNAIV